MKINKKVWILVLVVLVMLGLWKGCTGLANQELLESITLHDVKMEDFKKLYQTRGVVVSKKEVRYPCEGIIIETIVDVGDEVSKDDVLLKYSLYGESRNLITKMDGVVCEVCEQYVMVAKEDEVWIKVQLPSRFISNILLDDEVKINDGIGVVEKISSLANYHDSENYYDVYIKCDEKMHLSQEVLCVFEIMEYEKVYKVPFDAVVTVKGKEYVVLDSWLEDTMDFSMDDVVCVEVIGVEDEYVVIQCEERLNDQICVLSDLSLSFVKEMLELSL